MRESKPQDAATAKKGKPPPETFMGEFLGGALLNDNQRTSGPLAVAREWVGGRELVQVEKLCSRMARGIDGRATTVRL
jgi:hypothetical protein